MYPGNVIMWLSLGVGAGVVVSLATNTISTRLEARREAQRKALERLDNRTTMLEHQVELLVKAAVGHRP